MSNFRDRLRPYKRWLQHQMSGSPLEFENSTLPWIDRPDADIDAFLKTFSVPDNFPYDLSEKLHFWKKNGYVILEDAIPKEWCDRLWEEVEDTVENNTKHSIIGEVKHYKNSQEIPIKNIPKEFLKGVGARLFEYHNSSVGTKRMATVPAIATFLEAIFTQPVALYQSLIFRYSSQQEIHQDFPWVRSSFPSHLAASWIPLEDVDPDSGPLFYYPGSHKMPKFNFGSGILYTRGESLKTPDDFSKYLQKTCEENGLEKAVLLLKKGDALIWHAALAHGGSLINDKKKTRKSLVCHYTTLESYPKHRYETNDSSVTHIYNSIAVHSNPQNLAEEDCLSGGKNW